MNRREAIGAGAVAAVATLFFGEKAVANNENNLPVVQTERIRDDGSGHVTSITNLEELLKNAKVEGQNSKVLVWLNQKDAFREASRPDHVVWGEVELDVEKNYDSIICSLEKTDRSCFIQIPDWYGRVEIDIEVSDKEIVARLADELEKGTISVEDATHRLNRITRCEEKPRPDLAKSIRNASPERALKLLKAYL